MTLFAGAFALNRDQAVPDDLKAQLQRHLGGDTLGGTRAVHEGKRLYLVKWDSLAFGEPAWRESGDGSVCTVVGDPLALLDGTRPSREQQLRYLVSHQGDLNDVELSRCHGSFSLLAYSGSKEQLSLATDPVGVRPTYYVLQDGLLIFGTALRVLEATPWVRKRLSEQGMAEVGAFTYPLAKRTPYEGIEVLREGEILIAGQSGVAFRSYYDWLAVRTRYRDSREASASIYEKLKLAVRIRSGEDRCTYCFVSGGMDSRTILSILINAGLRVEALNFSPQNSQDQRFAQWLCANVKDLCTLHCSHRPASPNFSLLARQLKIEVERRFASSVDRPRVIWSGDGGSVGLGHVYMDEKMLDLADRDGTEVALRYFLRFNKFAPSLRVMTAPARQRYPQMVLDSVLSEVNRYPRSDIGRRIYLFLLFNDQRRHLFLHHETIDQHGLELLTPFFDTEFLHAVVDTPARWGILHRLYAQMYEHLPAFAVTTPWQTYPGHEPCPVPGGEDLGYQWAHVSRPPTQTFVERSRLALRLIQAYPRNLEPRVFCGGLVAAAAALHLLGLRDCRHLLEVLDMYRLHYERSDEGRSH